MKPTNTMQYKNYTCQVLYSNVTDSLTGKVLGMNSLPAFSGKTVTELREAFHAVMDKYLLSCDEKGEPPARAFTGNFTVRTTPAIHEALTLYAVSQGTVLAQVMQSAIYEYLENHDIQVAEGEG